MRQDTPMTSSSCLIRILEEPEGRFTAELLGAPDLQATGATREEAVEQLRALLQVQVNEGQILAIELPQINPILLGFGYAKDDPDFDLDLEEIRKFREEMDRREGCVIDTMLP